MKRKVFNLSQRDIFWDKVYQLAKENRNIIVVSADMGAPSLDKFRRDLPSQFVNVGIAEQNAISVAAGLALSGKKVFVYAIAPFIVLRCLEQIRVNCGIMGIPLTLVGVGAGFGYEDSGPTHHLIEDIGILRSLPNIEVNNITDNIMAEKFAELSCKINDRTNFIRLHRQILPNLYREDTDFSKGFTVIKSGKNYLITSGIMTHVGLKIVNRLRKKKIDIGLIDVYVIPIRDSLLEIIDKSEKLITLEEHFLPCGIGSNLAEMLIDYSIKKPLKRIGLPIEKKYCYEYGGWEVIHDYYGVSEEKVEMNVREFIK